MLDDLRYAVRSLRRTPGFTVAAMLTLALGIGATSSIFTIANAALFTPPPYPEPERLLVLSAAPAGTMQSGQLYAFLRDRSRSFERLAAQRASNGWNLVVGDRVQYVEAERISAGYFAAHRVRPLLGRDFSPAEDAPGGPDAVVVSERVWRGALDGRPDALGTTVLLGGVPHTVVGVMPASFRGIPDADVWTPIRTTLRDNTINYRIFGRLRDGVTAQQAAAELDTLRAEILREFPRMRPQRVALLAWTPLREVLGSNVRQTLLVLLGAVGVLLLIACVNVGSLHVTRALGRRRELATRAALGGTRTRLMRQLLAEALVLAVAGAAAGALVAVWTTRSLLGLVSPELATEMLSGAPPSVDWHVVAFMTAVTVSAALFFGVVPALIAARANARLAMTEGTTATASRRTMWLRRSLAGAEIALATVLLVGAGLLARSLLNLSSTELGFSPDGVTVGRMSLQGSAADGRELETLFDRGLDRLRAVPGVVAAAAASGVPVTPGLNVALTPPPGARIEETRPVDWRYVTADYFAVFRIPVLAGRAFDARDRSGGAPVAIVNEAFARTYFGALDVVGRTLQLQSVEHQIVGVAGNVKARSNSGWTSGLTALGSDTAPMVFVPAGQAAAAVVQGTHRTFEMRWAVRTDRAVPGLERAMRDAVRAAGGGAFIDIAPMAQAVARDLDFPRFVATLFAGFGVLAMVLSAIGLYGLLASAATQRTREIGIRMALGATARRVLGRFVAEGLAITAAGMAIGLAAAMALTRLLASLLFGLTPVDAPTFGAAATVLLAVAALATVLPSVRAARVDPVRALKTE